ncbi:MAG: dihydrodipicolinate synthase family protein [Bacillota bacterium]
MTAKQPGPLRGVITPLVTPLVSRDVIDIAGLERLIEHVVRGGVHGLLVLGSCGEGPSLSHVVRHEMVDLVCRLANGRVPVLVGITDTSMAESVKTAQRAADAGAAALVLSAPYYFVPTQAELQSYVRNIVAQASLPVLLYNAPLYTKIEFSLDTVRHAMHLPQVIGIKDSSGDMIYFHHLLQLAQEREDFAVLIGPEQLLAEALLFGAHGGVVGGSNLDPKLYVDLYNAATVRDIPRVAELHQRVLRLAQSVYTVARDDAGVIKGLKCALSCLGICEDFLADPLQRLRGTEREAITQRLEELGIGVLQ